MCQSAKCECRSLWINIYPAEGGEKVGGVNLEVRQGIPKLPVVRRAIAHWVSQERKVGRFVAVYRHCYGQQTSHSLPFVAAEQLAPIVVHFPPETT